MSAEQADQTPPAAQLLQMMLGSWITQLVYVAAKLRIADLLAEGPKSASQLAAQTGTKADLLFRVLRTLASLGILDEDESGFALTPLGAPLKEGVPGSVRATAILVGEEFYKAWGELLHQLQTGELAFKKAIGMEIFEFYGANPEAGKVLNDSMAEYSATDLLVLDNYDFSKVDTIVDVAGGRGALVIALLEQHPHLKGILVDLEGPAHQAEETLEQADLKDRCQCLVGDMFQSVPEGGDVYVLKRILHDWDDEQSVAILRNCRAAMKADGKLLIIEPLVRQGAGFDYAKLEDITMMLFGGEDRTEAHLGQLLSEAGFSMTRTLSNERSGSQCVEAVPV